MIRLFLNICKAFEKIKHLNDYEIYSFMEKSCFSEAGRCPSCGAPRSKYRRNGSYWRHFVCYEGGGVCSHSVTVRSVRCSSCMKSHALLVSVIIPYSPYSLGFIISLLHARVTGKFPSVLSLCEHFDISESTYYRLRKRFTLDSRELLAALNTLMEAVGLMESLSTSDPVSIHCALSLFFKSAGHSFMQPCVRVRPNPDIRKIPPGYCQISTNPGRRMLSCQTGGE